MKRVEVSYKSKEEKVVDSLVIETTWGTSLFNDITVTVPFKENIGDSVRDIMATFRFPIPLEGSRQYISGRNHVDVLCDEWFGDDSFVYETEIYTLSLKVVDESNG
jgi:hypothetical protein